MKLPGELRARLYRETAQQMIIQLYEATPTLLLLRAKKGEDLPDVPPSERGFGVRDD
jgi:hypothetical protein